MESSFYTVCQNFWSREIAHKCGVLCEVLLETGSRGVLAFTQGVKIFE